MEAEPSAQGVIVVGLNVPFNEHPYELASHNCLVVGTLDLWKFRSRDDQMIVRRVNPSLRINDGVAVRDAATAGLG